MSTDFADEGDPYFLRQDPTQCYAPGCEAENELLLHVAKEPDLFSDLCMKHALAVIAMTPLIYTCACAFCDRARRVYVKRTGGGPGVAS